MDSKIIKGLFTGTLADENIKMPRSKEYNKIYDKEYALYEKLHATLDNENLQMFENFIDLLEERNAMLSDNYFIRGFKFGVRLAVECFDLSDVAEEE